VNAAPRTPQFEVDPIFAAIPLVKRGIHPLAQELIDRSPSFDRQRSEKA
jgi:hypothetical protein